MLRVNWVGYDKNQTAPTSLCTSLLRFDCFEVDECTHLTMYRDLIRLTSRPFLSTVPLAASIDTNESTVKVTVQMLVTPTQKFESYAVYDYAVSCNGPQTSFRCGVQPLIRGNCHLRRYLGDDKPSPCSPTFGDITLT